MVSPRHTYVGASNSATLQSGEQNAGSKPELSG